MQRRLALGLALLFFILGIVRPVQAHANLYRSNPAANTVLTTSPAEIRLWFTEPVEPDFSRFTLRDSSGAELESLSSQIDANDSRQMYMEAGELSEGLYTVVWRVVSVVDGHQTQGSFAFSIGVPIQGNLSTSTTTTEKIPPEKAVIRWLNLLSLSLLVGSIAFWLFVWQPAALKKDPRIERRISYGLVAGWWSVGVTSLLMLLLQVSNVAGISIPETLANSALTQVVTDTYYGKIWIARIVLTAVLGIGLILPMKQHYRLWVALLVGEGLLLTNSLFSHAGAAPHDVTAAVLSDWLHLTATAFWVGGLIMFLAIFQIVRRRYQPTAPILTNLVGHFSNFARVSTLSLILTGLYASWLQVGSLEGLITTPYGQALLLKLGLLIPLLGLAAINLIFTAQGLKRGELLWEKRLRGLLGAEVTLTIAVLAVVGMMTSTAPARVVQEQKAIDAANIAPASMIEKTATDGVNVQLEITPGWVGENSFTLTLTDDTGKPIENASLLRLRFNQKTENLGESEIRPEHWQNGIYIGSGSNLSIPGEWQLRLSIQRPNEFDVLTDFDLTVAPPPEPAYVTDAIAPSLPYRLPILLLTGFTAVGTGGFFLGGSRQRWLSGSTYLAGGLLILGFTLLASALIN